MIKKISEDKYVRWIWYIFWIPLLSILLLMLILSTGLFGFMPSFEELENPKSNLATEIYSSDQVLLGTYYIQNRSNIHYSDLSPNVTNALIATEDARFEKHSGVDLRSMFRVMTKNLLWGNRNAGGGSTITQQLAKNLFPRDNNPNVFELVFIKLKEWITAIKLERNYTKQEILAMYLNTVDFGSQAYGIRLASRTYYGKEPKNLTVDEAAMLIGLLKAPTYYSPVRHPERALKRREVVLYQMKRYHYLTDEEYEKYSKIPFDRKKYRVQDQNVGLATYFREYLREYMDDWCSKHKKEDGSNYNLYKDGLKIYTTINSRMQRYAEEAVKEHLSKDIQPEFFKQWKGIKNAPFDIQFNNDDDNVIKDKDYYKKHNEERGSVPEIIKNIMESAKKRSERYINLKKNNATEEEIIQIFNTPVRMKVFTWHGDRDTVMTPMDSIRYYKYYLLAGLISIESQTGYVRAYVGGIDYRYFKYDHVVKSKRQVGSTFKPFVYALAMQEGEFSPCSKVPNTPVSFDLYGGQKWTPRNSEKDREGEMVTLKWALANSVNYVSAYLMKRYSPLAVVKLAQKMGVTSPIEPVYSICLGTPELTLYELTGAYNTFVNKGQWIEPIMITRIEDKNRRVLETFIPKRVEAMSEETAFLMIHLMRGVVESGTGARLRFMYNINNPVAGKTGTTQNNSDGWFIGLTPTLSTGVWVGAEDRSVHFKNTFYGQGANTALPIWAYYMKKVYKDKSLKVSQGEFESLSHEPNVELNCKEFESKKHKNSDRFDNENF